MFLLQKNYNMSDILQQLNISLVSPNIVGDFYIGNKGLVCLVKNVSVGSIFIFSRPNRLLWRPSSGSSESEFIMKCELPEILYRPLKKRSPCNLFVEENNGEYIYFGKIEILAIARMALYGNAAMFLMLDRLSREDWLRLSGGEWQVTVNGAVFFHNNGNKLLELINKYKDSELLDVRLARYDDDSIQLIVNGDEAVIYYDDDKNNVHKISRNMRPLLNKGKNATLQGFYNEDYEMRSVNVLTRIQAIQKLCDFFRSNNIESLFDDS